MTLAIFAALAARLGYRPVFLAGLTTFTLTSLGCALANKPEVLIGMRVLQGIGGAATLSIALQYSGPFPGRLLGRILGFHALLIASSSAIGPVLGGTILHTLSWQWLFAINVLPGTLALLLAVRALPRDAIRMQAPFDTVGAILSALLLGSTIMAANSLQNATFNSAAFAGWLSLR
jgi:DHA2 family multidrug resistance protein-like MFS transporter